MRLFLHQFRKDFRHTWAVWALWLLFALVQFALAAWRVNPADLVGSGFYAQLVGMIPALHAVLVFVLIPLLVFQEPPVGTTAAWLTRPMPPATVLGSKLAALAILVAVPLAGQCIVLAAHQVVPRDVAYAGIEIALKELNWIAIATALAALSPNFGVFLMAAAALFVLQYCSGWIWGWISVLHVLPAAPSAAIVRTMPVSQAAQPSPPPDWFLYQSRLVAGDAVRIAAGAAVVAVQYLSRRRRLALALAVGGLLAAEAAGRYWPWDFVGLLAARPPEAAKAFDAAAPSFRFGGEQGSSEWPDPRGGPPLRSMSIRVVLDGGVPDFDLSLRSDGGDITYPDGTVLKVRPNDADPSRFPMFAMGWRSWSPAQGPGFSTLDAAIGDLPVLNGQGNIGDGSLFLQDLCTIDGATFAQRSRDTGSAVFRLKGRAGGYRIAAEVPLRQGSVFADGSLRTTITGILHSEGGLSVTLQQRAVSLLLRPPPPQGEAGDVYMVVNRKRQEALRNENGFVSPGAFYGGGAGSPAFALDLGTSRFEQITGFTLAYRPSGAFRPEMPVPLDDAWLADARLVRLVPASKGEFQATLPIPKFSLDGKNMPGWDDARPPAPDLAALQAVPLPDHPTRPQAWRYIVRILSISARQRGNANTDPQPDLLAKVGPEHAVDLLLAYVGVSQYYPNEALKKLDLTGQADAKVMILRLLLGFPGLVDLVSRNRWEADAKPILLRRLAERRPDEYIDEYWLKALGALSSDPDAKKALLDLLPYQPNVVDIVTANGWEADAKPILLDAIAHLPQGKEVDYRWIRLLDSFHDDSRVKAAMLRALSSDRGAIDAVVNHHWEADAVPIMVETLKGLKPSDSVPDRWFTVLADFPDAPGVKEAILQALDGHWWAIEAVTKNHWEADAAPRVLDILSRTKLEGGGVDLRYPKLLAAFPDLPGAKEAVLRVLPLHEGILDLVIQNHWEADAEPALVAKVAGKKPSDGLNRQWVRVLAGLRDPATYPMLLSRTEAKLNRDHDYAILDDIRALPGPSVQALMQRQWDAVKDTDKQRNALQPAAAWGIPEALDRCAAVLAAPGPDEEKARKEDEPRRQSARNVFSLSTPCPDWLLDADIAAWYAANKASLAFDPALGRFLFHAKELAPDQGWPWPADGMRALGRRVAAGDPAAIDAVVDAQSRLLEGLARGRDEWKINSSIRQVINAAFGPLDDAAAKDPAAILPILDRLSQASGLRSRASETYGHAAEAGSEAALDALCHYADRRWSLLDAVQDIARAALKGNAKAIAFLAAVPADPNCTPAAFNQASGILRTLANAGNAQARDAFRAMQQQRPGPDRIAE